MNKCFSVLLLSTWLLYTVPVVSGELSCSQNGTSVFYINGVLTPLKAGLLSSVEIDKIVKASNPSVGIKKIDKTKVDVVKLIHNSSGGPLADILELYNQATQNLSQSTKLDFYKKQLAEKMNLFKKRRDVSSEEFDRLSKTSNEALELIFSENDKNKPKNVEELSKTDYYAMVASLDKALSNLLEFAVSDEEVTSSIISHLKEARDNNKKIITIAHSQGNTALNASLVLFRNRPENFNGINSLDRFDRTFGILHVASPTPYMGVSPSHGRRIRLNKDLIITGAGLILPNSPMPANFKYERYRDDTTAFSIDYIADAVSSYFRGYTEGTLFHGMNDMYLNDKVLASNIDYPEREIASMREIFTENLIEVAESLEDNCMTPIVKLSSSHVTEQNGKMIVDGFAGNGRAISLKVEDVAGAVNLNAGYDKKKTEFRYYIASIPGGGQTEIEDVVQNENGDGQITLPLPYNNLTYNVTVIAKNDGKETSLMKTFLVPANKPPTATIASSSCNVGQWGQNELGGMTYSVVLDDQDTYGVTGKVINGGSSSRDGAVSVIQIGDGYISVPFEIINNCPITYMRYTWEVRATCQTGGCIYSNDPNCNSTVNTGLQFNRLYVFHPAGELLSRRDLADGVYGVDSPGGFIDPNDHSQNVKIMFPTNTKCQPGKPNTVGIEEFVLGG
jgi:hypothetical protein